MIHVSGILPVNTLFILMLRRKPKPALLSATGVLSQKMRTWRAGKRANSLNQKNQSFFISIRQHPGNGDLTLLQALTTGGWPLKVPDLKMLSRAKHWLKKTAQ